MNNLEIRIGCDGSLTNTRVCASYYQARDGEFGSHGQPSRTFYCIQDLGGCVASIHKTGKYLDKKFWPLILCEVKIYGEGKITLKLNIVEYQSH